MDNKNVYIITGEGWDKESVMEELKGEGYTYDFSFESSKTLMNRLVSMTSADEVWCFGNCGQIKDYRYAKRYKLDIWYMG